MQPRDKRCLTKIRFFSEAQARSHVADMVKNGRVVVPLYLYQCPYAEVEKHFHITKQPNLHEVRNVQVHP